MKAKDVLKLLGVTRVTLYKYVKSGKVKAIKLPNGMYDYVDESVFKFIKKENRFSVIYGRVSTYKQKKDLNNQIESIKKYCEKTGTHYEKVLTDISSGLDLNRPNFSKLLDDIMNYRVSQVIISYKDRLTRLSFKILEEIFKKFGTNILVISEKSNNEKEYFEDLLTLMHVFSTKMYSKRKNKKIN